MKLLPKVLRRRTDEDDDGQDADQRLLESVLSTEDSGGVQRGFLARLHKPGRKREKAEEDADEDSENFSSEERNPTGFDVSRVQPAMGAEPRGRASPGAPVSPRTPASTKSSGASRQVRSGPTPENSSGDSLTGEATVSDATGGADASPVANSDERQLEKPPAGLDISLKDIFAVETKVDEGQKDLAGGSEEVLALDLAAELRSFVEELRSG